MPGRLTFRVLGPLEIEHDGSPLPLGGAKMRGLIALLLLRAGEIVSTDALVDGLWGEDSPPTARTALQGQVSKFRKLLARDETAVLETRGPGYVLRVDPEQLDLRRFERLAEEGRAALARGEPEEARETLGRALDLWRGQALAGLDLPGLPTALLADLEERRSAVLESRLEADLALGRHLEVVPELESQLTAQPLNERLHALAALALYRSGRQGDALEVCERLRRTLSEELGIEPSLAIQQMEQRILNHDPSLDLPAEEEEGTQTVREGRKPVTALVCRLVPVGDEGLADPEAQRGPLEALIDAATKVIETRGGKVHEALSGRIAAVFGIPRVHEDDASRAVGAAAELRRMSKEPGSESAAGSPPVSVNFRAGIATGEVLVEDSGRDQLLLSADPVRVADQLSLAAKPDEILLTQTALRLAENATGAEPAEVLLLDVGLPPMVAFRLGDASPGRTAGRRLSSPLVGREEELALLRQTLVRVTREQRCSVVTISGPAGVGKSKLVSEFVSEARRTADVQIGRCLSYGADITYWPIAEIVRQAAGIADADAPARARTKIAGLLEGQQDADFIEEQVAGVLGLADVAPQPDEIFWAIRKLLEAEARHRPLVVVFDDIHWAEATLLDLIEHIAAWTRGAAILIVCMARPELAERRPGWGGGRLDATNLSLGGLGPEESAELIDNLLGGTQLAEDARERIMTAAEGHPLFIEELLAMLIDDGMLQYQGDRWVAAQDLSEVPMPLTVQALLGARLDRLLPAERRVLEQASVVGREFTEEDLLAVASGGDVESSILDSLARKDLILPERMSPRAGLAFRFRHILIRDAVYQSMSKESRAQAHESFGTHLEIRAGDRIAEVEEIVGYHLEAAHRYRVDLGLPDVSDPPLAARAASRLASAGRRAFSRDDMPAAASLLTRGLTLLAEDAPGVPEAAWRLGAALYDIGQLARAEDVTELGLLAARRLGDEGLELRLRIERADLRFWREPASVDTQQLIELAEEAVQTFRRLDDASGAARAYRLMGDALNRIGRQEDALRAFEEGYRYAVLAGDEREISERRGIGVTLGPMPVASAAELAQSIVESQRRPNVEAQGQLGLLYGMLGRFDEARKLLEEALERGHDLGVEWKAASISMGYAGMLLLADDPPGAEAIVRPAVEALQRMGERSLMSSAAALLAEALYRQGKHDEAMLATLMSEEATAEDDVASQIEWRGVRAKVLAVRGELGEAERVAREGVAHGERTDFLNLRGDAHMALGTVLETAGRSLEAASEIEEAVRLFQRKGNVVSAAHAEAALAGLLHGSAEQLPGGTA